MTTAQRTSVARVHYSTRRYTYTILNDDAAPPPPEYGFSVTSASGSENDGYVYVTVRRKTGSAPSRSATFNISRSGTASCCSSTSSDVWSVDGSITLSPSQSSRTFSFYVNEDSRHESNETVILTLSSANTSVARVHYSTRRYTYTILNDDAAPVSTPPPTASVPQFGFSSTSASGSEGNRWVYVTVRKKSGPSLSRSVTFNISRGGSASSVDVSSVDSSITFYAGQSSKTFSFRVNEDSYREPDDTLTLTLSSSNTGVARVHSGSSRYTYTIRNDD